MSVLNGGFLLRKCFTKASLTNTNLPQFLYIFKKKTDSMFVFLCQCSFIYCGGDLIFYDEMTICVAGNFPGRS